MNILVTNDDGYQAAGMLTLSESLSHRGDVWIVAPRDNQSYMGHRITDGPLRVEKVRERYYVVDGTPADCVRVALSGLKLPIDLVCSGINHGANLGTDVFSSGTVAAAREACLHRVPAVAFSQYRREATISAEMWAKAAGWVDQALTRLLTLNSVTSNSVTLNSVTLDSVDGCAAHPDHGYFWNVNFPCPLNYESNVEIAICDLDRALGNNQLKWLASENSFVRTGRYQDRPRTKGSDTELLLDYDRITLSKCAI